MELPKAGKIVIVTSLFRLLFGGYLVGNDLYRFDDGNSALQVLFIYTLIGLFATMFISGKKIVLFCLIGLDSLFIIAQLTFILLSLSKLIDPGLHDPLSNWWSMSIMIVFNSCSLIYSLKTLKEYKVAKALTVTTQ
ncbi:MAG: hypothetical protein CVU42_10380 [Chloroflexi bacterium HGW-Chloroflexi-4]|jgi:hypothetical protein|nr:MAG: hypothetical protein CVU42_10380 [Chloroflexi bacterium HGW-Chloroflexi-4]